MYLLDKEMIQFFHPEACEVKHVLAGDIAVAKESGEHQRTRERDNVAHRLLRRQRLPSPLRRADVGEVVAVAQTRNRLAKHCFGSLVQFYHSAFAGRRSA